MPHPTTIQAVNDLRRRELLATVERERLTPAADDAVTGPTLVATMRQFFAAAASIGASRRRGTGASGLCRPVSPSSSLGLTSA